MPKYTKSVRKSNMRKNKRGRSRRGGYWFYPSPGDDEHAFTKLRNKFSTGSWKFWQKKPEEVAVVSDYQPTAEQPQGSLEYPQSPMESPETTPPMGNNEAMMESTPPMDNEQAPMEENPAPMETSETNTSEQSSENSSPTITGGRRRRQKRATKKRKRSNMRRRTNKRRRSNRRRR